MEKLCCGSCILGHEVRMVGNGITEPPYLVLIRCPFDDEYYKDHSDECSHEEKYISAVYKKANI